MCPSTSVASVCPSIDAVNTGLSRTGVAGLDAASGGSHSLPSMRLLSGVKARHICRYLATAVKQRMERLQGRPAALTLSSAAPVSTSHCNTPTQIHSICFTYVKLGPNSTYCFSFSTFASIVLNHFCLCSPWRFLSAALTTVCSISSA